VNSYRNLDEPLDGNRWVTNEQVSPGLSRTFGECGELLTDAIEAVSLGIVLVATDGRIFYANSMAGDLMRRGLGLRSSYGRLVASNPEGAARLPHLAKVQAAPAVGDDTRGQIIALPHGEGAPHLFAHIVRGQPHVGGAAIIIVDLERYVMPRLEAFALRYSLTPGESRVLSEIVSGRGLVAAARSLDIAESTARTHLRRVFGKTGAGRQTELLHLYFTGALPGAHGIGGTN
jgi:DNA-binding CsgD family transcriptional regulator